MTSQGQRFRRRALRRGYKVDEVDLFLDRVEATLNGERVDSPVRSKEVHEVVFRVRFGGYDEWQVDLHLDRVERQLADQEPGDFAGDRMSSDRLPERSAVNSLPERMPERLPERIPERMPERVPERMPDRMAQPGMAGPGGMGAPGLAGAGMAAANSYDRAPVDRGMPPRDLRDERMTPPPGARPPAPAGPPAGWNDGGTAARPAPAGYQRAFERPESSFGPEYGGSDPFDNEPTYSGFEPTRRARPDMTTEMRMPDAGAPPNAGHAPSGPPPSMNAPAPSMSAPPPSMSPPPSMAGPSQASNPGAAGGPGSVPPGEVQRIDQLRRTFQLRRFGSGYDRSEVDRLFEGVINTMSGRSTMPIGESELDPQQFNLVPGGYFESEVDQALREVRDIIRRR